VSLQRGASFCGEMSTSITDADNIRPVDKLVSIPPKLAILGSLFVTMRLLQLECATPCHTSHYQRFILRRFPFFRCDPVSSTGSDSTVGVNFSKKFFAAVVIIRDSAVGSAPAAT